MIEDASLLTTLRILHDLAVASQFGNQDRNLSVGLRGYYLGRDSGSQPRSRASIFFVVFFSLPTRVSLAGAVDGVVPRELLGTPQVKITGKVVEIDDYHCLMLLRSRAILSKLRGMIDHMTSLGRFWMEGKKPCQSGSDFTSSS